METLTEEMRSNKTTGGTSAAKVDLKFEVVVIPVSDVDRAKEFYARLGGASTSTLVAIKTTAWSSSRHLAPHARSSSVRTLPRRCPAPYKACI
jgi:hypothetical protein